VFAHSTTIILAAVAWKSGYTLLAMYLFLVLGLPLLGLVFSVIDYRKGKSIVKAGTPGWKRFGTIFLNNDIITVWCFLAGGGMILATGYILLLCEMYTAKSIATCVLLALFGTLLGLFGEKRMRR
jgi:ABC-type polysaccharide transport system permease subunit